MAISIKLTSVPYIYAVAGTYLQFSVCIPSLPAAYNIHIRWVKIAFHTPSSNSWRRSGTNIEKKSNPNLKSVVEKAFCGNGI
jgi:hypothetical protein